MNCAHAQERVVDMMWRMVFARSLGWSIPVNFFSFLSQQQTFQKNETWKALKECYLMHNISKRNPASDRHLLKKLINPHGGLLDVITNIYLKSGAYHPDSECCTFFHGNLSDSKSCEDTLLYLYLI